MELPFAGLHQLCAPLLDHLEQLPPPQRDALETAFGLTPGAPPDRFLVGLAVLSLLVRRRRGAAAASAWSTTPSGSTGPRRRCSPSSRGACTPSRSRCVFAVREPDELTSWPGCRSCVVGGLSRAPTRARCSARSIGGPLDERVRERIVAETRGNPLALLELPRGLSPAELGGRLRPAGDAAAAEPDRGELPAAAASALPGRHRRLLLVAAAEPIGEPALLWRAAERLGLGAEAAAPAEAAGLLELGARVTLPPPAAALGRLPRRAPAEHGGARTGRWPRRPTPRSIPTGGPGTAPRRRSAPDEDVADELERSAGRGAGARRAGRGRGVPRARRRADARPGRRARRALAAAQREARRRRAARRRCGCWRSPRPGRSTSSSAPALAAPARPDRVRPRGAAATLRRCCSTAARRLEALDAGAGARDVPRGARRGDLRRPLAAAAGIARRRRGGPRRARRHGGRRVPTDLLARRPGHALHRRLRGRRAAAEAGAAARSATRRRTAQDVRAGCWLACSVARRPVRRRDLARARHPPRRSSPATRARSRVLPLGAHLPARYVRCSPASWTRRSALVDEADAITEATGNAPLAYAALSARRLPRRRGRGAGADRGRRSREAIARGEGVGAHGSPSTRAPCCTTASAATEAALAAAQRGVRRTTS